ncbi:MAG: DUF4142 domain-containing protein [Bacteroidota bacterium]
MQIKKHLNCIYNSALAVLSVFSGIWLISCNADVSSKQADKIITRAKPRIQHFSTRDSAFITKAAAESVILIAIGKYAETNIENPISSKFGQMVSVHHIKMLDEFRLLANSRHLSLKEKPDSVAAATILKYQSLYNKGCHKEVAEFCTREHIRIIKDYINEYENGNDSELRKIAGDDVPHLKAHITEGRKCLAALADRTGKLNY